MQETLVFIKPDGVKRGLIGEVIARFERKGLKLTALKMLTLSNEESDAHYQEHVDRPFYPGLRGFITSGPIVAMKVQGDEAIAVVRRMIGDTDSKQAPAGTIRGDLSLSKGENIIHASDSPESAKREIENFF